MRRAARSARLAALAVLLLGGCVYYNGMYNTKRLAGSAQRAEREGRTLEANNLWGQVVTRAESLAVRHPDSKYVDEALVLKGIALARLGQCPGAVQPLARATLVDLGTEVTEEAALSLGRCRIELGDPGSAVLALVPVLESDDPVRRREARFRYARALRLAGRPDDALVQLDSLRDPRATEERLLGLAAAGRDDEALTTADSLIASADSTRGWDSVLAVVGRSNPRVASALVDRLGRRPGSPPAMQARRLLEDATRLEAVDSARAAERLQEVVRIGAGTESAGRAALRLLRAEVSRTPFAEALAPLADSLDGMAVHAAIQPEIGTLRRHIAIVRAAADSGGAEMPQGDLRLFLAAEVARDSLAAPELAGSLFRQVVENWPDSPYAPKALLAGRALDPAWGEQVLPLLEARYAGSPYVAFIRGEEAFGYRELEDSLQAYAAAAAVARLQRPPPQVRRPAAQPQIDDGVRRGAGQQPRPRAEPMP